MQEKLAQLEQSADESEEEVAPKPHAKPSLFAMLGDTGDDEDEDQDEDDDDEKEEKEKEDDIEMQDASSSNPLHLATTKVGIHYLARNSDCIVLMLS